MGKKKSKPSAADDDKRNEEKSSEAMTRMSHPMKQQHGSVTMAWLLPAAERLHCAALDSEGHPFDVNEVDAYAQCDGLFARQVEVDKLVQSLILRLQQGSVSGQEIENDLGLSSAFITIQRGLTIRANFAIYQKIRVLKGLHRLSEDERPSIIEQANRELKRTEEFLTMFQPYYTPFIDKKINDLRKFQLVNHNKTRTDQADDDCTVGTEEDEMSNVDEQYDIHNSDK